MDRIPDPYRELGVLRGATDAQVKAAHRRLAKRFHPDAPEGDTERFLAIQEAYLLLSDPLRRRDWDAAHAPGPVRAGDPARPRARGAGTPPRARPAGASGGSAGGGARGGSAGSGGAGSGPGSSGAGGRKRGSAGGGSAAGDAERAGGAWSASDREPSSRSTTWSASGVPWWEDFTPRDRSNASAPGAAGAGTAGAAGTRSRPGGSGSAAGTRGAGGARADAGGTASTTGGAPGGGATGQRTTAQRSPEDIDVYARSSGAAWSMAARRYFRKGEADLPKGGAWTYRGTQVVTGAEARKVAAEQAAERRRAADELLRSRSPGPTAGPGQAFAHEPKPASSTRGASGPDPVTRPATSRAAVPPVAPAGSSAPDPGAATSSPVAPAGAAPGPSASGAPGDPGSSLLGRVRRALGLG